MDKFCKQKGIFIEGFNSGDHYILYRPDMTGSHKWRLLAVVVLSNGKGVIHFVNNFKFKNDAYHFINLFECNVPNLTWEDAYKKAVPLANQ